MKDKIRFKICRNGAIRTVILFYKWAFKLPFTFIKTSFPYRGWWYRLMHGLLANIQEKEFSHVSYNIPLVPILFYVPGGWLSVMPRGEPISEQEFEEKVLPELDEMPDIVESKQDSFAKINEIIYAVDYGS